MITIENEARIVSCSYKILFPLFSLLLSLLSPFFLSKLFKKYAFSVKNMATNKDKKLDSPIFYCRFCGSWFLKGDVVIKEHYFSHIRLLEHLILEVDTNSSLEENKGAPEI